LPEALEDGGHAVEAVSASVHAREDGVELVGDALLFSGWWKEHFVATQTLASQMLDRRAAERLQQVAAVRLMA
jgi:hypothetical protein